MQLSQSDLDLELSNLRSSCPSSLLQFLLSCLKQQKFVLDSKDITTAECPVIKLIVDVSIPSEGQQNELLEIPQQSGFTQIYVDLVV